MTIDVTKNPHYAIKSKIADMLETEFMSDAEFIVAYPDSKIVVGLFPQLPERKSPLFQVLLLREGNVRQETEQNVRQYLGEINIYYYGRDVIDFDTGNITIAETDSVLSYLHDRVIELFDAPPNNALQYLVVPNNDGTPRGKVERITFGDIQELGLSRRESNLWNRSRIPFAVVTREVRTSGA